MNFQLDTQQQQLQDSVRRFVEREYTFEARRAIVATTPDGSDKHWQTFADNGWLAAALPEEHGGLGGSLVDTAIIALEFGRALVLEPYVGSAVLAAQTLVAGGTPAQKERLLPALAGGTARLALAYSEPPSRGLALPVSTYAEPTADGFALSGRKSLVLGGPGSSAFIVSARIKGSSDITLFLVDGASGGMTRRRVPLHDGTTAEELLLNGARVGTDSVVGAPDAGLPALRRGLAHGIVALGAELVGGMEKAIEITADYVKTRQQFGVPVGSFQVIQHRLADMATEMEVARSMLYAALANDDEPTQLWTLSAAKSLICRAAKIVCGHAIQLHGGIGMTEECAVGHYFRRAVVADLLLGSSERHDAVCALTGDASTHKGD